ncbi:MAG: MaoC family dehydratase N-terminal domain-containing protein [Proteobacteria bacterium]|nr:MaoC family dehydratase N-terminal domain-containing protein [Pseudomonadota bacterium]
MTIDLNNARPGDIVAEFSPPPSTPEDLARYAEASGDSNPLHLDPAFARQAGFSDLVVHGMLNMAHLGRLLTERFPAENIRSFSARFEGIVLVGQQVGYCARLLEKTPDGIALELDGSLVGGGRVISGKALVAVD